MNIKYKLLKLKYTTVAFSVTTILHIILYLFISEQTKLITGSFVFSCVYIVWGCHIYKNPTFSEFHQITQDDKNTQKKVFKFVGYTTMLVIMLIIQNNM